MTDLDFESSQLQLVTDALRAGPGSPEWRSALAAIENAGGPDKLTDEYKLLYTARERLASGQKYREVRAGVGFTRKVFESIENEETGLSRTPMSANAIVALSAVVILGILAIVAFFVMPHGQGDAPPQLSQTYFVNTVSQSNFENELPSDWLPFGKLGTHTQAGLQPLTTALGETYHGGGIYCQQAIAPGDAFSMQATVQIPPTDDFAVGIFVTSNLNFTGDGATTEQELVCLLKNGEASVVLPGGRVQKQGVRIRNASTDVQVNIAGNQAAVVIDGKTIWTGESGLDATKPRNAGVRFLAKAGKTTQLPVVKSVRVMTPQKS